MLSDYNMSECSECGFRAGHGGQAILSVLAVFIDGMTVCALTSESSVLDVAALMNPTKRMKDIPKKRKQPKGADWAERSKEEEKLKCALLKGSAWCTEKKYMRRYKGTFDIFFGIEHRLRKEGFAAHAARVTDESASSGDLKHT